MKVTRLGYKVNRFRILSAAVLVCSIPPIFALDGPLDVYSAKLSLQRDYAFMIGQQIGNVVCAASEADVKSFANQHLLNGGHDPFIQGEIDYIPKQRFSFTMNESVEDLLKGTKIVYHYCPKTARWEFDPDSTIATATNPLGLPEVGMVMITNYCMLPNESDQELCSFWFKCVMPPFNGNALPPFCSNFDPQCAYSVEPQNDEVSEKGEALGECFLEGEPNPDIVTVQDLEACPFPLYTLQVGELKIPRVALPNPTDGMDIFQARLCRSNSDEPPRFTLCDAAYMKTKKHHKSDTTFDANTSIVKIPYLIDSEACAHRDVGLRTINSDRGIEFEWSEKKCAITGRGMAQNYYVLLMVKKIGKAIDYILHHSDSEPNTVITGFLQELLFNDPFVKEIKPELPASEKEPITLIITMQDTESVDSQLRGEKYTYEYSDREICKYEYSQNGENGKEIYVCEIIIVPAAIGSTPLLENIGKNLIKRYCKSSSEKKANPTSWCPRWLQFIM